jgi:D-alanine-D-alanine ligase
MAKPLKPEHCRVALLAGGRSAEREVSLNTGKSSLYALKACGFAVTCLDPAQKDDLKKLIDGPFDVAFLCLHGRYGEDGTIQGLLDLIGLPYTGSGVLSSALTIDKAWSKRLYNQAGIKTAKSLCLSSPSEMSTEEIFSLVGQKCVVKPSKGGSAISVYIVESLSDLAPALEDAFNDDDEVIVESFIAGKEYTVAVLGNGAPYALPVIEIVPTNSFYDYESKYTPGCSEHLCPAPLDIAATQTVQEMALKAHKSLGCSGFSRSDFIRDAQGDFWILETNTLPGMTKTSLFPDAAKAAGIAFPELCKNLIEYALEKKLNATIANGSSKKRARRKTSAQKQDQR